MILPVGGEGFETFALGDTRADLDDLYDFSPFLTTAQIVAGRNGGQALQVDFDNSRDITLSRVWYIPISGTTSDSTLIRGCAFNPSALPTSTTYLFGFLNSEGEDLCTFTMTSSGSVELRRGGVAGTLLDATAAGALSAGSWQYLEFKVTLDPAAGAYEFRIDEATKFSDSGVNTSSNTQATQIAHGGPRPAQGNFKWDDLLLIDTQAGITGNEATDFLGDVFLERRAPDANDTNNWTGSAAVDHFTLLDEDGEDGDTSYIESRTAAQQELNNYEDAAGTNVIIGVLARPVVRKTDAGSRQYKLLAESNATVLKSEAYYPGTEYQRQSYVWETDPDTGTQWTIAGFNAATFGIEMFA